ncbi:MAG: class I SAM-dependent methyltransferase [Kiritimatiellae bacterium]|nr:class I SAM-dependent methyltransferase [Kiritimatiellia bacterium]
MVDGIMSIFKKLLGERISRKNFDGSIFDRFEGLDFVLARCKGTTVLDMGISDGLVSYEFARHGASLIHGFEIDRTRVSFARRLFRDTLIEHKFVRANLACNGETLMRRFSDVLLGQYDIVLFLGLYHHLKRQMPRQDLDSLLNVLLGRTRRWFAVRTDLIPELDPTVLSNGFKLVSSSPRNDTTKVGLLHIYERAEA